MIRVVVMVMVVSLGATIITLFLGDANGNKVTPLALNFSEAHNRMVRSNASGRNQSPTFKHVLLYSLERPDDSERPNPVAAEWGDTVGDLYGTQLKRVAIGDPIRPYAI